MAHVPTADRPRERLSSLGPTALTTTELLAILLGTGSTGRSAFSVSVDVLASVDGSIRALARRQVATLAKVPGLGRAKAARIVAACELARRLAVEKDEALREIQSPADVARLCGPRLRDLDVEEFHLLTLDAQNRVTRQVLITRGILNGSLVHPREVFRAAIAEAAAGIIVIHNHPSGNPTPSAEDRSVTVQLSDAGKILDVPVFDHVIVAGHRYFSFAEAGLL